MVTYIRILQRIEDFQDDLVANLCAVDLRVGPLVEPPGSTGLHAWWQSADAICTAGTSVKQSACMIQQSTARILPPSQTAEEVHFIDSEAFLDCIS